ncbi:unnamed protein product [Plutella xylostella]|uniref:(diamondback moth) hypothetical protein n=1 Tax=Plutella xylostella TaxID=51655 RepID=A0A8S4F5J8_PLUXY|nr:unnamed protein product [Plutella xylostella]
MEEQLGVLNVPPEARKCPENNHLKSRPRQQSLGGVLRREGNWKCFMLTLMIAGCLGSVVWCNTAEIDREIIDLNT